MNTTQLVDNLIREFQSTPKVLLVDDDMHFITLFRYSLEKIGAKVDSATGVEDAIDKIEYGAIKENCYDIIFLDLKIPPRDGPDVLKAAKVHMPKTPVVIVTGYPDSDLVFEAMKIGYLGLISKPIDFKELESLFLKHKLPVTYEDSIPPSVDPRRYTGS